MKQLVLQNKNQELVYRMIGILFLLAAVCYALATDWQSVSGFLIPILFLISSAGYVTNFYGTLTSRITEENGLIVLRWYSKIRRKRIPAADIKEVTGDDNYISIILRNGKPVRLPIRRLEPDEIRSVYKFLNEIILR